MILVRDVVKMQLRCWLLCDIFSRFYCLLFSFTPSHLPPPLSIMLLPLYISLNRLKEEKKRLTKEQSQEYPSSFLSGSPPARHGAQLRKMVKNGSRISPYSHVKWSFLHMFCLFWVFIEGSSFFLNSFFFSYFFRCFAAVALWASRLVKTAQTSWQN